MVLFRVLATIIVYPSGECGEIFYIIKENI